MKKLLLLFLLIAGGVSTASAFELYLICNENDEWNHLSYDDFFKFTETSTDHFRATVPGSYVNSSNWRFRFRAKDNEWWNVGPNDNGNDYNITLSSYETWTKGYDGITQAFYIPKNEDAKYVQIFCDYNASTQHWIVSSSVITSVNTYTIAYTNPDSWDAENVKVHAFVDGIPLNDNGSWPGRTMSYDSDNGLYTATITNVIANSFIKFSNNGNNETGKLGLIDDAVYNRYEIIDNQPVSISSFGNATFCSEYPLDFSNIDGLVAYRITNNNRTTGELYKEAVTKVPAGTGVYVEGTASQTYYVSPTATATSIGENMLVGTVSGITGLTQTSGESDEYTNYILTVNKADGTTASEPKFFKVNIGGNNVPANKAYLQIPKADAAREFFWFEGATSIESVKQNQTMNGEVYNLAGQRVAQPTNGLYIVNGKKVIMK